MEMENIIPKKDGWQRELVVNTSQRMVTAPTQIGTAVHFRWDKITLDTRKFTLKVSGDNVVFRTEDKTSRTESKALAHDLRALLTEAAKKQVKDVMEENPIDLVEMLTTTEEVLAKYD
jgi:hypothetical protein